MIASTAHQFIFIKTHKTAGTSVEIVLSAWCSGDDIVTPMIAEDEMLRVRYGGLPRNFGGPEGLRRDYIEAVAGQDLSEVERLHMALRKPLRRDGFYGHMPAAEVRRKLPELWESASTFAVERHPYEKAISRAYWWQHSRGDNRPVGELIEDVISDRKLSDAYLYTEGDEVIVDRVLPFGQIWEAMGELAGSLGETLPDPLPFAKGHTRKDRGPARDILTVSQRDRIYERCAFEFELMGFER